MVLESTGDMTVITDRRRLRDEGVRVLRESAQNRDEVDLPFG